MMLTCDLKWVFDIVRVLQPVDCDSREGQLPLVNESRHPWADAEDEKDVMEKDQVAVFVLRSHRHRPHVEDVSMGTDLENQ